MLFFLNQGIISNESQPVVYTPGYHIESFKLTKYNIIDKWVQLLRKNYIPVVTQSLSYQISQKYLYWTVHSPNSLHYGIWNKDDFKMVVRTHFASIGIFATFITLIVVGIFNASLYTCCVIRIGWFNTKFKFCHCRGCRCTKCVRMCMACNLPCADCCSNMCDVYDPENRRLTGRM